MDPAALMISFFFGLVGTAMFVYGRKAGRLIPLAAGMGLMGLPIFISNLIAMSVVCLVLMIVPFVIREG